MTTDTSSDSSQPGAQEVDTPRKVGLALSGGGFRASFFHIGVLAQMAQLGVSRHVEVISTVSGGSIIGALYYIHLKKLLEDKYDRTLRGRANIKDEECITDQDYLDITKRIETDFLVAVQKNIRMRTFLNLAKNLKMRKANYSRSDRIAELYDEYFYCPAFGRSPTDRVEMRELKITPKGHNGSFSPDKHNAARKDKIPILLINATTLNTGHNWRFEALRMGEPPRKAPSRTKSTCQGIDKNLVLSRPPSYDAIIADQQDVRLGDAVAASACVPGIFPPLAISKLYPNDIRAQLVDGGVHDNQGIEALGDRDCTHYIISDASGQMKDEPDPATEIFAVATRSNSILMDRVREEQLYRNCEKPNVAVAFMHLRKDLPRQEVPYIDASDAPSGPLQHWPKFDSEKTTFDVDYRVQHRLSHIRTDLDSFTDVEAYSLIADGYLMSKSDLEQTPGIKDLVAPNAPVGDSCWPFLDIKIKGRLENPDASYLKQLDVAGERLFKVFRLNLPLALSAIFTVLAVLTIFGWYFWDEIVVFLHWPTWKLLVFIALFTLGFIPRLSRTFRWLRALRKPSEPVVRLVVRAILPLLLSLFVLIHLQIFDRLFLRMGKLSRLK